jgi:hypothetical protein
MRTGGGRPGEAAVLGERTVSEASLCQPRVERLILLMCGKGSIMRRRHWVVGLLCVFIGMSFVFPAVAKLRGPAPIMPNDRFGGIGVLLPFGVVVTLIGLGLFGYSLIRVFRARRDTTTTSADKSR